MYVVCVSHPQPRLDVLGVKLRRLSHSFSSVIGRKKKGDAECRPSSRRQSRLDTFKSKLIEAMVKLRPRTSAKPNTMPHDWHRKRRSGHQG